MKYAEIPRTENIRIKILIPKASMIEPENITGSTDAAVTKNQ